jgi:hypothetical protein
MTYPDYPNVPACHYIKVNGTRCGSPALRNRRFCYFHQRWHEQRVTIPNRDSQHQTRIELPVLQDANSIQMALTQMMRLILEQRIDHQQARLLLYALQIASQNLPRTKFVDMPKDTVVDPAWLSQVGVGMDLWHESQFNKLEHSHQGEPALTPDPAQPVYEDVPADTPATAQHQPPPPASAEDAGLIPEIHAVADYARNINPLAWRAPGYMRVGSDTPPPERTVAVQLPPPHKNLRLPDSLELAPC